MSEEDKEAQADELLALASIYEEGVFTAAEDGSGGQFSADIQLPKPFLINLDDPMTDQAKRVGVKLLKEESVHRLSVHYLPPVVLNFQYPSDYPSCSAPSFTLSCKWLSVNQLSQLCNKLDELWTEISNEVILFMWAQFLLEESLEVLSLSSPLTLDTTELDQKRPSTSRQASLELTKGSEKAAESDLESEAPVRTGGQDEAACAASCDSSAAGTRSSDPRAIQDIASVPHLIPAIIENDQAQRQSAFNAAVYCCNVCISEKQGTDCILFMGCDHVYCKECMKEYFKVQIEDGNVKCLNCPETKCDSQALPSQVRELVGQELFATYDRLLLQTTLEGMDDIVYCPRTTCQCPVLMEKESTMGVCPSCKLAFCVLCKMTYHGTAPCRLRSGNLQNVLEAWRNGSRDIQIILEKGYGRERIEESLADHTNIFCLSLEHLQEVRTQWESGDPETRKELERRYGKKNLIKAVEENFSLQWLRKFSKQCPSCKAMVEKVDGCNKMTCYKCRAAFCWICMNAVSQSNPYGHFNTPGSPCYNLLFRGVMNDDDNPNWEMEYPY